MRWAGRTTEMRRPLRPPPPATRNAVLRRCSLIEHSGLAALRLRQSQVGVAAAIEAAPSCRAGDEAQLNEIGLDHILDGVAWLGETRGKRLHPHWAPAVKVGDHRQVSPVHRVEAKAVDLEPRQRSVRDRGIDRVRTSRMGEVPHSAEEPSGNTRRSPRPPRNLARPIVAEIHPKQPSRTMDHLLQLSDGVEVESDWNPKAVTKRSRQESLPRCRANQREPRQLDPHGAC